MKPQYKVVIPDTSCLILLYKIGELELLNYLFEKVVISTEINNEFGKPLPSWINIKTHNNIHYQDLLEIKLDRGEASAIGLHFEINNSIVILDDLKARFVADKIKVNYTGTFGVILRAKKSGIIKSVKPILNKIRKTNFRFSNKVFNIVLKEAGEDK